MNEETAAVARKVNDLIKEYVKIEDDLFKPSFRKSIPIPGIFKPVDYVSHMKRLLEMEDELEEARHLIRSMKPGNETSEGQFLITLRAYSSAFLDAMVELKRICGRLDDESKKRTYPKKEYEEDAKGLRKLEMKYFEIGRKLNEQLKTLDFKM
jgi:hypothetical protein